MKAGGEQPRWRAPYRIETERSSLCALGPEHLAALQTVVPRNKPHLAPTMPWVQDEPLSAAARLEVLLGMRGRFDLGSDFTFGIFTGAERRYVGGTGLHPRVGPNTLEIGYWIDQDWQGRGIVGEAVQALCAVAIEFMGARRVEIRCAPSNLRSRAIPERLGFHLDGILREVGLSGSGEVEDRMIWTLLAREYADRPVFAAPPPRLFDVAGSAIEFDFRERPLLPSAGDLRDPAGRP